MPTRVIHATVKMVCCRDGQQAYNPYPREVIAIQTKKKFSEPIELWKKRAERALNDKYRQVANNECSTMGTLTLCYFNLIIHKALESKTPITETGIGRTFETKQIEKIKMPISTIQSQRITSTPNFIYQQLELIRERMIEADSVDELIALRDEMDKIRKRYNI